MATDGRPQPGGFILQSAALPSPAPSTASSNLNTGLPHPRGRSLHPGSNKEETVRRYVEERLLYISRCYVKKFGSAEINDTVIGYRSFSQVCRDMDEVVNVLWLSGTPSLQIPFLLKVASDFTQYVQSFPPSPRASFNLLGKLDHCFASLLSGQDVDSKESLPGFENGPRAGFTITDMVRCRSLVEQTRLLMINILGGYAGAGDDESDDYDDNNGNDDEGMTSTDDVASQYDLVRRTMPRPQDDDDDEVQLDAVRIYQKTLVSLGDKLGDTLGSDVPYQTTQAGIGDDRNTIDETMDE